VADASVQTRQKLTETRETKTAVVLVLAPHRSFFLVSSAPTIFSVSLSSLLYSGQCEIQEGFFETGHLELGLHGDFEFKCFKKF
jgi:hypothetical protein